MFSDIPKPSKIKLHYHTRYKRVLLQIDDTCIGGVSPCLRRVRILEEAGIIQQYTALIDAEKVGKSLTLLRVFG